MSGFFNYDNVVWRFIGKFGDIIVLNLLWCICSLPIFTIGASTTAVYYVTLKLARDDEGYTIKSFFKSFKENFKQATCIWMIAAIVGVILSFDIFYFVKLFQGTEQIRNIMLVVMCAFFIIYYAILLYVFPLQSRFYNPVKRTIFNAFFMSIRHFFQTLGMFALDGIIVFLMFSYVPQLILFGFPLVAFLNSYMFNWIFRKYISETDEEEL